MPKLITKNDIEEILGYTLTDYGYKSLAKCITNMREGKYIIFARGDHRTSVHATATVLDGILPKNVIFDEFKYEEIKEHKEERKMDLDDDELKATLRYSKEDIKEPDVRRFRKRYKNIGVTL